MLLTFSFQAFASRVFPDNISFDKLLSLFNFQVNRQQSIICQVLTCILASLHRASIRSRHIGCFKTLEQWKTKTCFLSTVWKEPCHSFCTLGASSPFGGYCEKLAAKGGKRKEELTMIFDKTSFPPKKLLQEITMWQKISREPQDQGNCSLNRVSLNGGWVGVF